MLKTCPDGLNKLISCLGVFLGNVSRFVIKIFECRLQPLNAHWHAIC